LLYRCKSFFYFTVLFTSYAALLIPYKISFTGEGDYPEWDILDYIIDTIFFIDIIINFLTS